MSYFLILLEIQEKIHQQMVKIIIFVFFSLKILKGEDNVVSSQTMELK